MAACVGVKRRNAHKAVYALFAAQIAVSIMAVNLQRSTFYASFIAGQIVQHFNGKALALGITGKHAKKHACPVLCFGTAGTGMQG